MDKSTFGLGRRVACAAIAATLAFAPGAWAADFVAKIGHLESPQQSRHVFLEKVAALVAERTDGAPVRRALHNLRMAIHQRLEKEGADNQTMFDVAALIDEAASKIERL